MKLWTFVVGYFVYQIMNVLRRRSQQLVNKYLLSSSEKFSQSSRVRLLSPHNLDWLQRPRPSRQTTFSNILTRSHYKATTIMCKRGGDIETELPSTMRGEPMKALVPPGQCQFNDTPIAVTLLQRWHVSPTSCVLRFSVPDVTKPLNLSTCACMLAVATINDEVVVRPYTPISTNHQIGSFDLLIKNYGPTSKMSHFMCDVLQPGETFVSFKHIEFNVKTQAPFPYHHIGMLVGGTGTSLNTIPTASIK
jgi:Oxidoreductase FAD-binding domain